MSHRKISRLSHFYRQRLFSIFSAFSFTGSRKLQPGDLFFNPSPFLTIATQKDLVVGAQNKTMFLRLSFFRRLVFAVPVNCAGLAALQVGHHTEWGLGQALWSHNMYECSLCRFLFARSPPALAVSAIMLPFGKATRSCTR